MATIAVIRMKGRFSMRPSAKGALESLGLATLYSCTLVPDSASYKGMLQSCKDVVSFGEVGKESVQLLLTKRGIAADGRRLSETKKPEEIAKMAQEIAGGRKPSEAGVSPLFRLSPPKGGFGSRKSHAPFGPLGKNPGIPELIARMA